MLRKNTRTCLAAGCAAGAAYFLVAFLVFGAWVHYFYAGEYSGPLMISTMFGVSVKSAEAGAKPIYETPVAGWDGQFYYTQSNDPFLLDDYSDSSLFDNLSYRYQRIGLPALAWLAARIGGLKLTTPLAYFLTQLAIMSVGFGALVAFLVSQRVHWAWACVWGFYGGVLKPALHGLPDPTADCLLLFAILATFGGRLFVYMIVGSLLCLCRESYAAPAAVIWLLTVLGKLQWNQRTPYWLRVVATAVPGMVVVGWAYYVAFQTETDFLSGSRSVPSGGLVDWPFKGYLTCLWQDLKASNEKDVLYATSCALCLVVVFRLIIQRLRVSVLTWAILPHVVLMTMTGWIVWEAGVGFFKNTSSVVLVGVLLLGVTPSRWLRGALLFTLIMSLHSVYRYDFYRQAFLPPLNTAATAQSPELPSELVPVGGSIEYSSRLSLIEFRMPEGEYRGLFRWFHRDPQRYTVRITNTSEVAWPASIPGEGAISLGLQFLRGENVLREERLALYKTVLPGDELDIHFAIPSQPGAGSGQRLRVGLVQGEESWFYRHDADQKLDIAY